MPTPHVQVRQAGPQEDNQHAPAQARGQQGAGQWGGAGMGMGMSGVGGMQAEGRVIAGGVTGGMQGISDTQPLPQMQAESHPRSLQLSAGTGDPRRGGPATDLLSSYNMHGAHNGYNMHGSFADIQGPQGAYGTPYGPRDVPYGQSQGIGGQGLYGAAYGQGGLIARFGQGQGMGGAGLGMGGSASNAGGLSAALAAAPPQLVAQYQQLMAALPGLHGVGQVSLEGNAIHHLHTRPPHAQSSHRLTQTSTLQIDERAMSTLLQLAANGGVGSGGMGGGVQGGQSGFGFDGSRNPMGGE